MMIVNATVSDEEAEPSYVCDLLEGEWLVWSQTVTGLTPGQPHDFSYWIALSYAKAGEPPLNPPVLETRVDGVPIGTFDAWDIGQAGVWYLVEGQSWTPGSETAKVQLVDLDPWFAGDDYSLDDISLEPGTPGEPEPFPVAIDIKPRSCPNPINRTSPGIVPIAILGTADFDVTSVDPTTVELVLDPETTDEEEIARPVRWSLQDVAAPYMPVDDADLGAYACATAGPDGFIDMLFMFETEDVAALMKSLPFKKGDVVTVTLRGYLFDTTAIVGADVMVIAK